MTLTVNPTYNVTDAKTICASELPYTWNGVEFTAAGTQSATLTTVNNCPDLQRNRREDHLRQRAALYMERR